MNEKQIETVYELLSYFNEVDLLKHFVIVGSWAEYFLTLDSTINYMTGAVTRDIDILIPHKHRQSQPISLIKDLKSRGFIYDEDILTGIVRFTKGSVLDLEFMTINIGMDSSSYFIRDLNISVMSLRELNFLEPYSKLVFYRDLSLRIPEPATLLIHKILIHPSRSTNKKQKDLRSIIELYQLVFRDTHQLIILNEILHEITRKQHSILVHTSNQFHLHLLIEKLNLLSKK